LSQSVFTVKKQPRIFYGWWIVGACFAIALYTGGVVFYGFTAIFEPLVNDFGWSYTQVSLAASLRGLEAGLVSPLFGILVDRWGPKRLIFGGAIVAGLGFILLSRINSLAMFYGLFILVGIGMSALSSTVLMAAVANWFQERIGVVSGIVGSGFGFSGLMVPLVASLVNAYKWRMAVVILGIGLWVVAIPLSLIVRHKPEHYGYLPDGKMVKPAISDADPTPVKTSEKDTGIRQALKSGTFWGITLALVCHAIMVNAVVVHVMPYLNSIGFDLTTSSLVASAIPLMTIGGRVGFGWLGDKLNKRLIFASAFLMMGLGLLCFEYVASTGTWVLWLFLILFGTGVGCNHVLRVALVLEHFGRKKFGTIFGLTIGIMMVGQIIGAPLVGWFYDNWGSYQGIWIAFAGLSIVAVISALTIHPKKATVTTSL